MISYVWGGMMLLSLICAAITGRMPELSNAVFSGGESAISLCISLLATIPLWSGLMNIAESSGIVRLISRMLRPLFRLIFRISPDSKAAIILSDLFSFQPVSQSSVFCDLMFYF